MGVLFEAPCFYSARNTVNTGRAQRSSGAALAKAVLAKGLNI